MSLTSRLSSLERNGIHPNPFVVFVLERDGAAESILNFAHASGLAHGASQTFTRAATETEDQFRARVEAAAGGNPVSVVVDSAL